MVFLSDMKFWSLIIALTALVLSQLPPIKDWFKKAKIDFELYSKISLTHKVGNPNLQLHLIISNIGGRKVRVKKINATVSREGSELLTLPAVNYLQDPSDKNNVLFTSFSLDPEEEWGHIVNLLNFFGREEEKEYRKLESDLISDIREKRKQLPDEPKVLIEADPDKVNPIIEFFDKKYIWTSGEYALTIGIETENSKVDCEKCFRFTIFESHEEDLKSIRDDYKYGAGVYWDSNRPVAVIVDVKEA
jgi:hypothetical protein